ncbi:DUF4421 family protein [Moheibacter sediminis]|uniref:DUF4421 domain-containing protein n=1 Tax=Moheibacter sediminis TaxID=1434700 RepID=A0A1W1YLX9_9FLAO|nr:DUF4421 family protein [Moheibacter sediminis]SMC37154.1 protein of unknown function [Moheibacter sediminis]
MNYFSKSIFALILQINLISIVYAQNSDSIKFISYKEKIMLKVNLDTQTEEFVLSNQNDIYKLALNNKIKLGLSIDYEFISAIISFTPNFLPGNNDDQSKGKSSFTDLKFRFFPGRFIQTFHYKRLKGFYLKNTREFIANWQEENNTYLKFPDLKSTTFGGSTSFVFRPEFSLKSLLYQREWQKYSAGSLVPSVNYDLTFLTDDFGTFTGTERELDLSLDLAYYYNWVIAEKFTVAPYAYTGAGVRFTKYRQQGEINSVEKNKYFTYEFGTGIYLGFNSDKFLFGGRLNYASFNYKPDENRFTDNSLYGLIFVGYRFNPPKKVENIYEKVEEKNPF